MSFIMDLLSSKLIMYIVAKSDRNKLIYIRVTIGVVVLFLVIIILILLYRYKLRSQKEGIALNEVISSDVEITERLYDSKNEDELDDENTKSFLEQNINKNELLPKK